MNICYLILAHNNPRHFGRLLDAIATSNAGSNAGVFVHIDAKSDASTFAAVARPGTVFVTQRVSVSWGGYSMVQASLNLLGTALSAPVAYDYYCLLSGSDYPLKPVSHIEEHFRKHRGSEFINLVEIPNATVSKPLGRITQYWLDATDVQRCMIPPRTALKISRFVGKLDLHRDHQRALGDLKPYAGSQWWALTRAAALHVMQFVATRPRVVRYFRNTYIPDESFFQTIIGNSAFKENVRRNLTFTDWSRKHGPYPAVVDDDHLQFFRSGDVTADDAYGKGPLFFARKFPDASDVLVAHIQQHVW